MAVSPKSIDESLSSFITALKYPNKSEPNKIDFTISSMDFSDEDHAVKMAFPIDEDHGAHRIKKKKFRRSFSRVLKGSFFQASSSKKTRSKKTEDDGISKPYHGDDRSTKIQKEFKFKLKKALPISSVTAPSDGSSALFTPSNSQSSSSSFSQSVMSDSRSTSARKSSDFDDSNTINPEKNKSISLKKLRGGYNCNLGLYFLLISLLGLVFSGKAFAIFCTTFLFFIRGQVSHVDDFNDFDFDYGQTVYEKA